MLAHKKYLKTARGAQQAMEKLSEKEAKLDDIRRSNQKKTNTRTIVNTPEKINILFFLSFFLSFLTF